MVHNFSCSKEVGQHSCMCDQALHQHHPSLKSWPGGRTSMSMSKASMRIRFKIASIESMESSGTGWHPSKDMSRQQHNAVISDILLTAEMAATCQGQCPATQLRCCS